MNDLPRSEGEGQKLESRDRPGPFGRGEVSSDEEIDLVDLWIGFWSLRKVFLSTVVVFAIIGIAAIELSDQRKPTKMVYTYIELNSIFVDGKRILIETPEAVVTKIGLKMNLLQSSPDPDNRIKSFIAAATVSSLRNSNIVLIVSETFDSEVEEVSQVHKLIIDEILPDLDRLAQLATANLRDSLFSVQSRLIGIGRALKALEHESNVGNSAIDGIQSSQDLIDLQRQELQKEIDLLKKRRDHLELTLANMDTPYRVRSRIAPRTDAYAKSTGYVIIVVVSILWGIVVLLGIKFAAKVRERTVFEG